VRGAAAGSGDPGECTGGGGVTALRPCPAAAPVPELVSVPGPRSGYLPGLDLLRVVASTLVVYTHVATWFAYRGYDWSPAQFVDRAVGDAFRLNTAFSFVGVATFLVVSGVVVTQVTAREGPGQFLWRRVSRIAPLLFVATAAAWALVNLDLLDTADGPLGVGDLLRELVLANLFLGPVVAPLAVTWTLLVQIAFYAYVSATIPLLRRWPWLPPTAAACLVVVTLSVSAGDPNAALQRIAGIAAYLPVLCVGQVISLVRGGRLHPYAGTALGALHFLIYVWVDRMGAFSFQGVADSRTVALVVLVVLVVMNLRGRITTSRLVRSWSARTYAIYLVHPLCVYPVIDLLAPRVGVALALLVALVAVGVVSEVLHRFVERPANRWLRGRRKSPHPSVGVVR
jgi:peptidoglycan/LPS O-acetylase OafA/YrhL